MKKLCVIMMIVLAVVSFSIAETNVYTSVNDNVVEVYYHCDFADSGDYDDTNTNCLNLYGNVIFIIIDATGTDTDFDVNLAVDPREIDETKVSQLYTVGDKFEALNAANDYYYPMTCKDQDNNVFGGVPVAGALYVQRAGIAETVTDLKIYIYCETRK